MLFTMLYPDALAGAGQFSDINESSELFRVHGHRTVVPEYGDILHGGGKCYQSYVRSIQG